MSKNSTNKKDFDVLDEIREQNQQVDPDQVEKDVSEAIRQVRKQKNSQTYNKTI